MGLSFFSSLILGPRKFPPVRGQELPDPVGDTKPRKELPADSRFVSQGWDTLNRVKSPPRNKQETPPT